MSKTEIRNDGSIELINESRLIKGYAIVFNVWSNPLRSRIKENGVEKSVVFREMILPNAFDGLIDNSDVVALYNHDEKTGVLARSKNGVGSLRLTIDERGLAYEFEAPETTLGNDTLESLRRKDISSSSFAFSVLPAGERWTKEEDGTYRRYIEKANSFTDVSLVVRPAYNEADVSTRGLQNIIEVEEKQNLLNYYNNLKQNIKWN